MGVHNTSSKWNTIREVKIKLIKREISYLAGHNNEIYVYVRKQNQNIKEHSHKNIERRTAHTIVSWPNPKQWVVVHTSDLMMIIRQSIYILSIITKGMGKLKTHSPTYCIMDNWENMLNLTRMIDYIGHMSIHTPNVFRIRFPCLHVNI